MAICRKCGHPLSFIQKPGRYGILKWWPVEPDGTNHFDICREYQTAAMTPKERAARAERDKSACPPGTKRGKGVTHVYAGDIPPWDLPGEFRVFTREERELGVVCRKI